MREVLNFEIQAGPNRKVLCKKHGKCYLEYDEVIFGLPLPGCSRIEPDGRMALGGGAGVWEGDCYTPRLYANLLLAYFCLAPKKGEVPYFWHPPYDQLHLVFD